MLKYDLFRPAVTYMIIPWTPKLLSKKIKFFVFAQYKNECKEHNF